MNDKLIFVPFAFDKKKSGGVNISKNNAFETYCKNICVSLVSLKRENSNCDVALVTNYDIPKKYSGILIDNGVFIFNESFNKFVFPDDFKWSLAFYKLCALSTVIKYEKYNYFCYLDADIICNGSFDAIWEECEQHILLFDINEGLNSKDYQSFLAQVRGFLKNDKIITHYGGEFVAANKKNATEFVEKCVQIYNRLVNEKYNFYCGDEFILSLAADELKHIVRNAGAYIFRFWTGYINRFVCTCYKKNGVLVLHMPGEKEKGIKRIFDKYLLVGKYPSKKKIYKMCHLEHVDFVVRLKSYAKNFIDKMNLKR